MNETVKKKTVKIINGIKTTVYVPKNIPEYVRQEKINYIYDILKSKDKSIMQTAT